MGQSGWVGDIAFPVCGTLSVPDEKPCIHSLTGTHTQKRDCHETRGDRSATGVRGCTVRANWYRQLCAGTHGHHSLSRALVYCISSIF
jgi:hypothetical protein